VVGFGFTLGNVVAITVRQTIVPDGMLGRVTSVYRLIAIGAAPIGALAGGFLARAFGLGAPFWAAGGWDIAEFALSDDAPQKLEGLRRLIMLRGDQDDVVAPDHPDRYKALLPQIEMPINIQADTLSIDGLRITQSTQPLIDIRRARGGIDIGDGYFHAEKLTLDSDR
jgi:MFS family permease